MSDATKPCVLALTAMAALSFPSIAADTSNNPVTFARDVAPILQERCQECHRKGSTAHMSLVTYAATRPWAKAIRQRVIAMQMPPPAVDRPLGARRSNNDISW